MTGVDNSRKLEFMRSLGADEVIDYRTEDFTRTGQRYDVILDLVGGRSAFALRRFSRTSRAWAQVIASAFSADRMSLSRLMAIRSSFGFLVFPKHDRCSAV